MKTKIFTLALIPVIILLFALTVYSVYEPINRANYIVSQKNAIIAKLKFIRSLQIAYQGVKGEYAGKWAKLINFAENGVIPIIQTRDIPIPGKDGQYRTVRDTIGSVSVKDSILNKFPQYNIKELALIPNMGDRQFALEAKTITIGSSKTRVSVFEVKDIYPIDPMRGAQFNEKGEPYSTIALEALYEPKLKALRDTAAIYKTIEYIYKNSEKLIKDTEERIAVINKELNGDKKEEKEPKKGKEDEKDGEKGDKQTQLRAELQELEKNLVAYKKPASKEEAEKAGKKAEELSKFINLYDLRLKMIKDQPLRIGSLDDVTTEGNWE